MRNIYTIMCKELKRFFGDRRMLASLVLPGVLIFLVYSLMGTFMGDMMGANKSEYNVYVLNNDVTYTIDGVNIITTSSDISLDEAKTKLTNEEIDLVVYYPKTYNDDILNGKCPNIELYYYSKNVSSEAIYQIIKEYLTASSVTGYVYTINFDSNIHDLTSSEDLTTMLVGMLVPFLLMVFLATGCMAVATESFAGEKERGTIATLLVTPIKRTHLALGKVFALTITALLSAVSSLIGLLLSLPKLMGQVEGVIDMSVYSIDIILPIIGIIIVTVVLFIVLISIVSVFAKSVKEATSYSSPLMILITVLGALSMAGTVDNTFLAVIPVYNSINSLSMIFSQNINIAFILITIASNLIYIALGIFALTKMFENEKVIFNK